MLRLLFALTIPLAMAQTFDVASIRLNTSGSTNSTINPAAGGRYSATNVTVFQLVRLSFNVQDFQIADAPEWFYSLRYDVEAKAADQATPDQLQMMVQTLLKQRFGLSCHRRETREGRVLALVAGRSAHKNETRRMRSRSIRPMRKLPRLHRPHRRHTDDHAPVRRSPRSLHSGQNVVDRSNIPGTFDLTLEWTPTSPRKVTPPPCSPPFKNNWVSAWSQHEAPSIPSWSNAWKTDRQLSEEIGVHPRSSAARLVNLVEMEVGLYPHPRRPGMRSTIPTAKPSAAYSPSTRDIARVLEAGSAMGFWCTPLRRKRTLPSWLHGRRPLSPLLCQRASVRKWGTRLHHLFIKCPWEASAAPKRKSRAHPGRPRVRNIASSMATMFVVPEDFHTPAGAVTLSRSLELPNPEGWDTVYAHL